MFGPGHREVPGLVSILCLGCFASRLAGPRAASSPCHRGRVRARCKSDTSQRSGMVRSQSRQFDAACRAGDAMDMTICRTVAVLSQDATMKYERSTPLYQLTAPSPSEYPPPKQTRKLKARRTQSRPRASTRHGEMCSAPPWRPLPPSPVTIVRHTSPGRAEPR
jgi:hypothetical protein